MHNPLALFLHGLPPWTPDFGAVRRAAARARCAAAPMPTRTDCAALRAQATSWRTPTSSGSSMAAFGSWSTRWSSHMLERWCAQPPPTHHHPLATPPQLAADILVPVRLQEAAGPCKGVVMTQEAAGAPCTRARAPLGERGCYARSVANGARDGECLLAAARVSCVMCPDYGVISV